MPCSSKCWATVRQPRLHRGSLSNQSPTNTLAAQVNTCLDWIHVSGSHVPDAANQQCICPRGAEQASHGRDIADVDAQLRQEYDRWRASSGRTHTGIPVENRPQDIKRSSCGSRSKGRGRGQFNSWLAKPNACRCPSRPTQPWQTDGFNVHLLRPHRITAHS